MSEPGKPRHIRDIAHIYLSRMQSTRPAAHDRLLVCGESRATISAFHTAAMAAAFAMKGASGHAALDVRVFEVSGVLPNTGYYFALPAHLCLGFGADTSPAWTTALFDLKVCFTENPEPAEALYGGSSRLEIYHVPPYENRDRFLRMIERLRRKPAGNTLCIYVTHDGSGVDEAQAAMSTLQEMARFCTLHVGPGSGIADSRQLGCVRGWESRVTERIPAVCRDPRATLVRRYDSICEGLICRIRENRRRYRGSDTGWIETRYEAVRSNKR